MKFSHSLQFNAVPEWSSNYIAYSHLKKIIYALQKEKLYNSSHGSSNGVDVIDSEASPLLPTFSDVDNDSNNGDDYFTNKFIRELNVELKKINRFYSIQERTLFDNFNDLKNDIDQFDSIYLSNVLPLSYEPYQSDEEDGIDGESMPMLRRKSSLPNDQDIKRAVSAGNSTPLRPGLVTSKSALAVNSAHASSSGAQRKTSLQNSMRRSIIDKNILIENKITIKKRLISIFTQFNELLDYVNLNLTGFNKICKKFDKSLDTNIKTSYLNLLSEKSKCFKNETIENLKKTINEIIIIFAKFSNSLPQGIDITQYTENADQGGYRNVDEEGNEDLLEQNEYFMTAKRQLSSHLRDHIIWERNTVWKDMINLERKSNNVNNNTNLNYFNDLYSKFNINDKNSHKKAVGKNISASNLSDNSINTSENRSKFMYFILFTLLFVFLLFVSPFSEDRLQKNCFAILIYSSLLWATETLPLFVTSLLIPLLIVILPVIKNPNNLEEVFTPIQASQFILSTMWSSVIMLLLGGFTLAAALSKYNIAKIISTKILSSVGTNPKVVLLTMMFLAYFISMWVSNVAAPVICFSIIQPILRTLPKNSTYGKSLILGIALASNIGGMSSPISSPQNIFALSLMDPQPSWIEWFAISIPISVISIFATWILLLLTFPIDKNLKVLQMHPIKEKFTIQQWSVCIITCLTILLWCFSNQISNIFGEMGTVSIIPLVMFFGTGLLNSEDFNSFMWTIVILAMGGTTLGKAVSLSGLLSHIANIIKMKVEHDSLFTIVIIFGLLILMIATFVSHVVAAMIVLPLMKEIGSNLPLDHSRLLIMVATLLCSAAMGLPTSGIPNVTAISLTDELGNRYLTVSNFITRGVPASLFTYFVIITVGFALLKTVGF